MDAQTKIQALQLIAAIIRGLGDRDRNVVAIQSDALKAAVRVAKEAATAETCLAAAGIDLMMLYCCKVQCDLILWECFAL